VLNGFKVLCVHEVFSILSTVNYDTLKTGLVPSLRGDGLGDQRSRDGIIHSRPFKNWL